MILFGKIYMTIRKKLFKIDDRSSFRKACDNGMTVGKDCSVQDGVMCDPSHSWLISIGNRVTLAPRVVLLAHDASTKRSLGYTMIGRVRIGDDVFIGAGSIVLPGVTIGNNVIIGAGTVVSHSIADNSVVVGNPCRIIKDYESFIEEKEALIRTSPLFDKSYRLGEITQEKKDEMIIKLASSIGYIK